MTPRGASLFVGACLLLVAVLLAVVPFSHPLPGINIALNCDPPVAAAWSTGQKDQLSLWVVTVGGEMVGVGGDGRTVGDFGPWCGAPARQRLLVSGGVVVAAVAIGVAGLMVWRRAEALLE
jgi:hypothetical protein